MSEYIQQNIKRMEDKYGDILLAPVDELEFTIRVTNCLASDGIKQVKDLVQCTEVELLLISGFGKKCLAEVKEVLAEYNLSLNTELSNYLYSEAAKNLNSRSIVKRKWFLRGQAYALHQLGFTYEQVGVMVDPCVSTNAAKELISSGDNLLKQFKRSSEVTQ